MRNNPARAVLAYFVVSGLSALAVLGGLFSSPSDPHRQFLLGLSISRLAMAGAFAIAAVVSTVLAWYSWRQPAVVGGWIRNHLSQDGWLRIFVFFASASAFLVALAIVCFRDWLPISPKALSHLQPAVVWVMIVATLNMLSVVGLQKAEESRPRLPAIQSDSADPAARFLRDFIVGCLVVLLSASAVLVVNLLIGVLVRDHSNAAMLTLVADSLPRGGFRPEQVERTRYITTALLFPIFAFLSWILAGILQGSVPRSTNRVGAVTMLAVTVGVAFWLFASLRDVGFRYLRPLYPDLDLAIPVVLFVAFVALICVERRYSSRIWLKFALGAGTISIGVLAGLAVISASLLTSADEYVYSGHFNAYFYSIVQVLLGKTLLVDLTNQYGFYPYFLEPILHLIGFDVPQMTVLMSALHVGFLAIVYFLLTKLVRSRLIAITGFISISCVWLGFQYGWVHDPYFQYIPHRVIIPAALLLLVYLYQKSRGRVKRVTYALAFLVCGAGLLWNFDTGAITFAAWVLYLCWETLLKWHSLGPRSSAVVIAVHSIKALATLVAALGLLLLYTYLRSGSVPDLGKLGLYQSVFYQSGYYMLPMPLFHPWNLVVLTYMAGLCVCAAFLLQRLRGIGLASDPQTLSWVNMVFLVSIMGVGLFTVYQGRSHDLNLVATFWSAFLLSALFADALMGRTVRNAGVVEPLKAGLDHLAMVSLPLFLLFILFTYVPPFFRLVPSSLRGLQAQLGVIQETPQARPNAYTQRLDFMRAHIEPGEEVPIFSLRYSTSFYIETRTTNPVRAPGWNELVLQSDVSQYRDYLASHVGRLFLVSDEFGAAYPDLYSLIQQDYVEVGRAEDLALYERRHPAR